MDLGGSIYMHTQVYTYVHACMSRSIRYTSTSRHFTMFGESIMFYFTLVRTELGKFPAKCHQLLGSKLYFSH